MTAAICLRTILKIIALGLPFSAVAQLTETHTAAMNSKLESSPLLFMENKGQVADRKGHLRPDVLFSATSSNAQLFLTATGINYQFTKTNFLKGQGRDRRQGGKTDALQPVAEKKGSRQSTHRFSLQLQGANPAPVVLKEGQSSYTENYYLPQCPNGITGVRGYEKITLGNVYPHIDWVLYSRGGFMEYDFLVHPGGDPAQIRMKVKDALSTTISSAGELVIKTRLGELREKAPVSYADGRQTGTRYKKSGDGTISFAVASYYGKELRIDPSVTWATYYGGDLNEAGYCTLDGSGNVYLAGYTASASGIASGGFQNNFAGGSTDGFLVKFDNNGNRLWATYFGGPNQDNAYACAVDGNGNIYATGQTGSFSGFGFGGFQNLSYGVANAFLVKFSPSGSRIWSTYYGGAGSTYASACTVDADNNVYMAGTTPSTTNIAYSGFQNTIGLDGRDAFLVKFNSAGSRLWATYYGGERGDEATGCTTDKSGNVYLTGTTLSASGIASGGAFQTTLNGTADAFLVKFNSAGNRLWSTYYGGDASEQGLGCAVDKSDNVYLAGQTTSSAGIASNGFQNTFGGMNDAYLVKFTGGGARIWATYYGGGDVDFGLDCAVDSSNNVYLTGQTASPTGIASGGFQNSNGGGFADAMLVKFGSSGTRRWATYYGGNGYEEALTCATDKNGNVYMAGFATSAGLTTGGFQNSLGGNYDAFLMKIDGGRTVASVCRNGSVTFNAGATGSSYQWQVNTGVDFVNINDDANYTGTNTATLQLTGLPTSWYGYLYRCVINGSSYTESYQLRFSTTWTGGVSSAWENGANWQCNALPDGYTDVVINSGPVVLASNAVCRTLVVKPGVSLTVRSGNTLTVMH